MKHCPSCNRTFENSLTYCLIDGSVLSAPFSDEPAGEQADATQVLPSTETLNVQNSDALETPQAPTMTAIYQPQGVPHLEPPETIAGTEKKPFLWLVLAVVTALFFFVAIPVLMFLDRREMGSYAVFMLVRRSPLFLVALVGITLATVRMKRHPRASLMTIVALLVFGLAGSFFTLLLRWLSYTFNVSSAAIDRIFTIGSVIEDFVFSGMIILLVAAAYSERNRFRNLTTGET